MAFPLDPTAAAPFLAAAASDDFTSLLPQDQNLSSAFNALLDLLASVDPDADVSGATTTPDSGPRDTAQFGPPVPEANDANVTPTVTRRASVVDELLNTSHTTPTSSHEAPSDDEMAYATSLLNAALLPMAPSMPQPLDSGSVQAPCAEDVRALADPPAPAAQQQLPKRFVSTAPIVAEGDAVLPTAAEPAQFSPVPVPAPAQLPPVSVPAQAQAPTTPQAAPPQSGHVPSVDTSVRIEFKDTAKNVVPVVQQVLTAAASVDVGAPPAPSRTTAFRLDVSRDVLPKRATPPAVDSAVPVRTDSVPPSFSADNESAFTSTSSDKPVPEAPTIVTARTPSSVPAFAHLLDVRAVALAGENAVSASASAPASELAGSLTPEDLSPQIVQAVRLQWSNGTGDVRITLRPEYLGDLTVSLHVEHGNVSAVLHAESPAVRSWLQANEPLLGQALSEQGLTLERLVVAAPDSDRPGTTPDQRRQQQEQPRRQPQKNEQRSFEIVL